MKELLKNVDKIHTTLLGEKRIKENLDINEDVLDYCKKKVLNQHCQITRKGKNWYCEIDNVVITINAYSYTIITAHIKEDD